MGLVERDIFFSHFGGALFGGSIFKTSQDAFKTEKRFLFSCVLPRWILEGDFCHPGRNFTKVLLLVWWGGGSERRNYVKMFEEKSKFLKSKKNIGKFQPAVGLTDA